MSSLYLLGIDIGTYSSKGSLVRETGELVAWASREHDLSLPKPGFVEHDPDEIWMRDFYAICRNLLKTSGVNPSEIGGIGVSAISPAVVPVDAAGNALRPAILYGIDTRASNEVEELHRLTGAPLSSQSGAPKILWIRRNEPEIWKKTARILNGGGYIAMKLCGEATLDVYDAMAFNPLFDPETLNWSDRYSSLIAPLEMLPRIGWTCDLAGRVTREAATRTGLAAGTPVIVGTADAAAEAASAGFSVDGDLLIMHGSSAYFLAKTPGMNPSKRFWPSPFLEPGSFVTTGGISTTGSLTKWFREEFGDAETRIEAEGGSNAYEALAAQAALSPPGAKGLILLPYFSGERTPIHDPHAKGMLFGLTLSHRKADVYRALLESTGFAIRHNLEMMREEGIDIRRTLATGGGTRNDLWMRIVSDIAGIEQRIADPRGGASYGDAFLAGVGIGLFSGVSESARWAKTLKIVTPNPDMKAVYDPLYEIYRELYERNKDLMRAIDARND